MNTNGSSKKIRVALIGVGNCASSLVQGVEFYREANEDDFVPGLMHVNLGGYRPRDIEFTAAFDIHAQKVGRDLAEAIFAGPNNTARFAEVPPLGVKVHRGMTHDGLGKYLKQLVPKARGSTDDIVGILKKTRTDVVVSYLPVGSEMATKWYVEQVLEAGCAFELHSGLHRERAVLAAALRAARAADHRRRHQIAGRRDDRASHSHRPLPQARRPPRSHLPAELRRQHRLPEHARARAARVEENLENAGRDEPARHPMPAENVHVGPSDYVPWLTDRKWCYIRMEGTTFGNVPLNCEVKLEVWDSPNSAGVVIDAIRCAKIALDHGIGGPLIGPASYFMKSPPVQFTDDEARLKVEAFIAGEVQATAKRRGRNKVSV